MWNHSFGVVVIIFLPHIKINIHFKKGFQILTSHQVLEHNPKVLAVNSGISAGEAMMLISKVAFCFFLSQKKLKNIQSNPLILYIQKLKPREVKLFAQNQMRHLMTCRGLVFRSTISRVCRVCFLLHCIHSDYTKIIQYQEFFICYLPHSSIQIYLNMLLKLWIFGCQICKVRRFVLISISCMHWFTQSHL